MSSARGCPLIEPPDVTQERVSIGGVDDYVENLLVIRDGTRCT